MYSYIAPECRNYICSIPPKHCATGDMIVGSLFVCALIWAIYKIIKSISKNKNETKN